MKAAGASVAAVLVAGCSTGDNGGQETTTGSGGLAAADATTEGADETTVADGTPSGDDFQTPTTEPPPTVDQDSDDETAS